GRRAAGRELPRGDVWDAGERRAASLSQGDDLFEISLPAATTLDVAPVEIRNRLGRRSRQRPVRACVQICVALEDRELGAGLLERHEMLASTGVWSLRTRPSTRRRSTGHSVSSTLEAPRTRIGSMPLSAGSEKPHSPAVSSA